MKRARQAQPVAGTSRSESVVQPNFSFVSTEQCDTADSSEPPLKRVTKEVRLVPRRRHSELGKQHKKERNRAKLKVKTPTVVLSQADTPTTVLPPKRARSSSGSAEQPATPDAIAQAVAFITCAADAQDFANERSNGTFAKSLRNLPLPDDQCLNTLQAQAQKEGNGLDACVEKMEQMLRLVTTNVCA